MKAISLKKSFVAAALIALLAFTCVGTAFAYYTDTQRSNGMIVFGVPTTEITETQEGTNKQVTIKNTGEANTVVRVKVFCAPQNATLSFEGEGWVNAGTENEGSDEFGWFYYNDVLAPGEETSLLRVVVEPKENAPEQFDVTVIQQCASQVVTAKPLSAVFSGTSIDVAGTALPAVSIVAE